MFLVWRTRQKFFFRFCDCLSQRRENFLSLKNNEIICPVKGANISFFSNYSVERYLKVRKSKVRAKYTRGGGRVEGLKGKPGPLFFFWHRFNVVQHFILSLFLSRLNFYAKFRFHVKSYCLRFSFLLFPHTPRFSLLSFFSLFIDLIIISKIKSEKFRLI